MNPKLLRTWAALLSVAFTTQLRADLGALGVASEWQLVKS